MALFCARYLTTLPFSLGLSWDQTEEHAKMGYYLFQDYAAAFWWKHAYRMISTPTDIDTAHYNTTLQAIARAMEEYSSSDDHSLEAEMCPLDILELRVKGLAGDARGWEAHFKIESRTQAIRVRLEELLIKAHSLDTHRSMVDLYGEVQYKCHKPWCQFFCVGFERHKDREQHLREHDRPFRCPIEGCYRNEIGFSSESDLRRHSERLHLLQPFIHFTSIRPPKDEQLDICSAAYRGDLAKVQACLSAGIDIDHTTTPNGGKTPLFLATEKGHVHICRYLLEKGAFVNFQGGLGRGRTALHAAALADDEELTDLLLSQPEMNPQLKDKSYFTAAGYAAKNGCCKALSVFISKGIASSPDQGSDGSSCLLISLRHRSLDSFELLANDPSIDLEKGENNGFGTVFPLHETAEYGLVGMFKVLLFSGRVDTNVVDYLGRRALHYACENGHMSIIKLLLGRGNSAIDSRDDHGMSPLFLAIQSGHTEAAKLMLEKGADSFSKDNTGRSPFFWAAKNGPKSLVKLMFEKDAKKGVNSQTILLWAMENGDETILQLFLTNDGMGLDIKDNNGQTTLSWAARKGDAEAVKLLLVRESVDPNSKDSLGRTPLWWAVEEGYEVVVELLLAKEGIDPDSKDLNGLTPLRQAIWNKNHAVVKLLLENGVNPNAKHDYNRTPLSWAAEKGDEAIVNLLLAKEDIDLNSKDNGGRTPLSYAAREGHEEIVKLLVAKGGINPYPQGEHV